ncbi:MAG TPA: hypothetical protein VKC15_13640 [Gemmatimonadales bacterium]|nr:hypothetical protein [Gemmatimonadales bacterium]
MRSFLRAGLALGLLAAACKDAAAPGDFSDPVAVTTDMQSVDSAFDSDVYRSFSFASLNLGPAATGVAPLKPAATLLGGTVPKLDRSTGHVLLVGAVQAQRLQQLRPAMDVAAAQGSIIPDSVYGRVFQWDTASDSYKWQDSIVAGLNGVRFILYQVDEFGFVVEPTVEVGTLDVIDESTLNHLQLHILVKGLGGTPTYLDYTASISATQTSVTANATGSLSNGLVVGNKTLTFDETFTVTQTRVTANATFTLNDPARTFTVSESATVSGQSLVITGDFRFVRPGETVQFYARLTIDSTITISATVRVNGRTVATFNGEPGDPGTLWKDAGGDPLTADDIAALEALESSAGGFQQALNSLFLPVDTFFGG